MILLINIPLNVLNQKICLILTKQTLKQKRTYLITDISLPFILLAIKLEQNIEIMEI
jgi:hypothetical protein